MVACSGNPIPLDFFGLVKLTAGLARVEERLQMVMGRIGPISDGDGSRAAKSHTNCSLKRNPSLVSKFQIPNHMSWIVTMWHFGTDSLNGYSGDMFEIPWNEGLELLRIYSKQYENKKVKIRKERQEYPNKPLGEAFMEKLTE
jgi:hypothetical protein